MALKNFKSRFAIHFAWMGWVGLAALNPSASYAQAAEAGVGYVVIKEANADFKMEYFDSRSMGARSDWRPPQGRVSRTFAHKKSGDFKDSYEVLLDNGRGMSTTGYVSEKDVAFFKEQKQAEAYAESVRNVFASADSSRNRPNSTSSSGPSHDSSAQIRAQLSNLSLQGTGPTSSSSEARLTNNAPSLPKVKTLTEAQEYLGQIQGKLKSALGETFLRKVKDGWAPSPQDRIRYINTIEKTLDPQEKAFFAMVSTSFAEDRMNASNPKDPEDAKGKASMLFTMKTIENRTESRFAKQFMDSEYLSKDSLEKIWGVVTADRQFSSWNAGSVNFGKTIRAMLGVGDNEAAARNRALASYRDYSLNKVNFEGFGKGADGSTLMLNKSEVKGIREYMAKDLAFRRANPDSIVTWTVESIMHNPRYKTGVHQVALRVPTFSISVPKSENSHELIRVESKDIGHWPVILKNVATKDMEAARLSQGAW